MKQNLVSIVLFLSLVLAFQACNKASLLGYDLFADDQIGTAFIDTMTVTALTERGDSVRTYSPSFTALNAFLCGDYYDQVVGRARSIIRAWMATLRIFLPLCWIRPFWLCPMTPRLSTGAPTSFLACRPIACKMA